MGAGGAGKALAFGGKEKGARVVVANRSYGENLYLCAKVLVYSFINVYFIAFKSINHRLEWDQSWTFKTTSD